MFLTTPAVVGPPAGAAPCRCGGASAPSQQATAIAKLVPAPLLPPAPCLLPTALLLDGLGGVGAAGAEQRLHVALLHDRLQRSAALDDLAPEAFEDHLVAGLQVIRTPALAANRVRAR